MVSVSDPQDQILAKLLDTCEDQIVSFHEHDSLLDHIEEEELTEAECKDAWAEYRAEVKTDGTRRNKVTVRPSLNAS